MFAISAVERSDDDYHDRLKAAVTRTVGLAASLLVTSSQCDALISAHYGTHSRAPSHCKTVSAQPLNPRDHSVPIKQ